MEHRALTLGDRTEWARLLAVSFDRTQDQMEHLLDWFHEGYELVTWGAWDGDRLVAQYNARLLTLDVPRMGEPALAGMGLNMAVDPAYRGRGLLETVATPVHRQIAERGCIAGVGFSSAGGLDVTRASRSYAYEVLGPMTSTVALVAPRRSASLEVSDTWPEGHVRVGAWDGRMVRYHVDTALLRHRFGRHPFRRYRFAYRRDGDDLASLFVFRQVRLRGLPAASLLAAYGDDLPRDVPSFGAALGARGIRSVHAVTSPASPFRHLLGRVGPTFRVPFSRHPYHLIARALRDDAPSVLFDLSAWDCTGGDIL